MDHHTKNPRWNSDTEYWTYQACIFNSLAPGDPLAPGDIGQYRLKQWLNAWRHQAIT